MEWNTGYNKLYSHTHRLVSFIALVQIMSEHSVHKPTSLGSIKIKSHIYGNENKNVKNTYYT